MRKNKLTMTRLAAVLAILLCTINWSDARDLLFEAIINGEIKKVKKALKLKASAQSRLHGSSPLHVAAYYGRLKIAELLLNEGADINDRDLGKVNPDWRPIHYAIINKKNKMAIYLMKKGAELNVKTKDGGTPLHFASSTELTDVIEELIKGGAELNPKTDSGLTPLDLAKTTKVKSVLILAGAKSGKDLK
ncbi:MAG: ankyrin repeat domain-containing protein [Spirochaetota bacterium]|nr:ankyrin repeat domain-containing protein [Spirochaetota bacterium]